MYVITRAINRYDQDGEYFVAVYDMKPTLSQLAKLFYSKNIEELGDSAIVFLVHLRLGGGRRGMKDEWFFLNEISSGVKYVSMYEDDLDVSEPPTHQTVKLP